MYMIHIIIYGMVVPTIDSHHHIWLFPHWSTSLWSLFPPLMHIITVTSLRLLFPPFDSHHHIWLFPPLIHITSFVFTIDPYLITVVPNIDPHHYGCCSHHRSTSLRLLFPPSIHITTVVVPTIDPHHYGCSHHQFPLLWLLFPPLIHITSGISTPTGGHKI